MPSNRWIIWTLLGFAIVIIAVVVYVVYRIDQCCGSARGRVGGGSVSGSSSGGGPGEGPIIVVQPTGGAGGGYVVSWYIGSNPVTSWGHSGQVVSTAFGNVKSFFADGSACSPSCPLTSLTLSIIKSGTDSETHTVKIERTASNEFAWTVDNNVLIPCDYDPNTAAPDCAGQGLPPEFNGKISAMAAQPAVSTGMTNAITDPSTLSKATMQETN